jgi:hypothetical protein
MNYAFILTVIAKVETWVPYFYLKMNCYSATQKYFSQQKKFHILEKMLTTISGMLRVSSYKLLS